MVLQARRRHRLRPPWPPSAVLTSVISHGYVTVKQMWNDIEMAMKITTEDIVDVLESIDKNKRVEGDIIKRHKVKGNALFYFDHYESTFLSVSRDLLYIVDYYSRKKSGKTDSDPIFRIHTTGGLETIASLILHFDIDVSEPDNILESLFDSMKTYAKDHKMKDLDLFGKLFKEINLDFVGECCM